MYRPFIEPAAAVSKINVTPIIDVALVLVIILMVTAPMITVSDLNITLPPAATRSLQGANRVALTIGGNGELAVDDVVVSREELIPVLRARLAGGKDETVLVVRADEGVPYSLVQKVLSDTKDAGAARIAIGTRQRGNRNE